MNAFKSIHKLKWGILLPFVVFYVFSLGAGNTYALVNPRGSDRTHDIATWNLRNFPLQGNLTVSYLTLLVRDLQLDLIAVQEIESVDDFNRLLSNLNGWDGVLSPHQYNPGFYQKTGLLYNNEKVSVGELTVLFEDDEFAFPRPPIEIPVTMIESGDTLTFRLIVIHLKAGGGDENLQRRRAACVAFKEYVDQQMAEGDESKWMIAGDFNDEIDDPPQWNAFNYILDDPQNWIFLTEPLAGNTYYASFPTGRSLIDHLLVTRDLRDEYSTGETETLRLGDEFPNYPQYISDHRPVASYFPAGVNAVPEEGYQAEEPLFSVWPIPANASVTISINSTVPRQGRLDVFDLLGRHVAEFRVSSRQGSVVWQPDASVSGIFFLRLETGSHTLWRRAVILR